MAIASATAAAALSAHSARFRSLPGPPASAATEITSAAHSGATCAAILRQTHLKRPELHRKAGESGQNATYQPGTRYGSN